MGAEGRITTPPRGRELVLLVLVIEVVVTRPDEDVSIPAAAAGAALAILVAVVGSMPRAASPPNGSADSRPTPLALDR